MREAVAKWPLVMFIYFIFSSLFPHDAYVGCPSCLERNARPEGETRAYDDI